MNQHETLPMGEFAIGTNTTAYAMAERFGITDRLPILIVEKWAPILLWETPVTAGLRTAPCIIPTERR